MGIWDIAAGAVNAVGNVAGSIIQSNANKKINQQNIEMQRETNQLQRAMFDDNLNWQRESQNIQNEYNSLKSQVSRALAAGVSPAALFEGVGTTPASVGSGGSSIPNLTAPHAEFVREPLTEMIANVSLLARAQSDIAKSRLDEQTKDRMASLLGNELEGLKLDNNAKKLANNLTWKFGDQLKQAEFDYLVARKSKELSASILDQKMSDTEVEKQFNLIADTLKKDAERLMTKKELRVFDEKFKTWQQDVKSQIQLRGSQSTYNLESAKDLRETRLSRVQANQAVARMNNSVAELNNTKNAYERQTLQTRVLAEMENLTQMENITSKQSYELGIAKANMEQAMYENDMKKFTYWFNIGKDVVNTAATAVNAVKGLPIAPSTSQFDGKVKNDFEESHEYEVHGSKYYKEADGTVNVRPTIEKVRTHHRR